MEKLIEINGDIRLKNDSFIEKKIRRTSRELQLITPKIDVLLEQMTEGNMSKEMFRKLMKQYELKQIELSGQLVEQKAELSHMKNDIGNIKHLIDCFKKQEYIDKLDRETVVEMIDYIEVFKKERIGAEYMQRVDIHFNFVGQITIEHFQALKDYIRQQEENRVRMVQVG